jgi:phosphoglycerate dehydrogenase-like enzyme
MTALNEHAALVQASDVLSVHAPLSAATAGLVGAAELARMKPTALLVNTCRGGARLAPAKSSLGP